MHRECGIGRAANVYPSAAGFLFCLFFSSVFFHHIIASFFFLSLSLLPGTVSSQAGSRVGGFHFCSPTCETIGSPKCEYDDDRLHQIPLQISKVIEDVVRDGAGSSKRCTAATVGSDARREPFFRSQRRQFGLQPFLCQSS
jgi:hypothetical protein